MEMEKDLTVKFPGFHNFAKKLWDLSFTTLLLSVLLTVLWRIMGKNGSSSDEIKYILVLSGVSGIIPLYPSMALADMAKDPEKFFSGSMGKFLIPVTVLWMFVATSILDIFIAPLIYPSAVSEDAAWALPILQHFVWILGGSMLLSLACVVILGRHWLDYRAYKRPPKTN